MAKRILISMLIVATAIPIYAQRMLDLSNGVFSSSQFTVCAPKPGKMPDVKDFSGVKFVAKVLKSLSGEGEIVREDRIWRYYSSINCNMEPSEDIYLDVRFYGTTEIEGQEYLNCYAWKADKEFSEETAALIGYMREDEEGKVYVRYIPDAHVIALEKGIDILPYAPMMAIHNHDIEYLSQFDVLIYDPNLKIGDTLYSTPNGQSFTVFDLENLESCGKAWKRWDLMDLTGAYDFVEGVGSEYGLMPFPGTAPIMYGTDAWTLVEMRDDAGTLLFDVSQISTRVDKLEEDAKVVKEIFHNLNGIKMSQPTQKGTYIQTQVLENGDVRTRKIIVK